MLSDATRGNGEQGGDILLLVIELNPPSKCVIAGLSLWDRQAAGGGLLLWASARLELTFWLGGSAYRRVK